MSNYELTPAIRNKYEITDQILELRDYYESSLWEFAKYVNPTYMYDDIHEDVFNWFQRGLSPYQLLLLPRDHLKSHCVATWCSWQLTKEPWSTIVYLSAGEDLALNQMYAIKNMLYSEEYKLLWPEMINEAKSQRDKDTTDAINLDHPERKRRRIRDNSLIIKTVKSNAIGLHCSHLVLDDVVIPKFAYTANGRLEVQQSVAQFASIKSSDAITKGVGTRYHPEDLYENFREARIPILNDKGEFITEEALWDIREYQLETHGDGTGKYLWPRTFSPILKKWFGFDMHVRAQKKAEYDSLNQSVQFRAQYYNQPNDPDLDRVKQELFQYYDSKFLREENGSWYFKDRKLAVFAGMDVAFTDIQDSGGKRNDYTAICVIGIDYEGFVYILTLDRFKTDDYDEYYKHVMKLHEYWGFKVIQVETNTGGKLVKKALEKKVREEGRRLVISARPSAKSEGSKHERHAAIVEPLYANKTVFHFKGGLTSVLEDEIRLINPPNDDLEDALFLALIESKTPSKRSSTNHKSQQKIASPESRFGGRRSIRGTRLIRD